MKMRLQDLSPLIVIGMHRSGTRLIAQILERLGIFMGSDQQADAESIGFMLANEGLLHQCGAFWSEPMSAHFLLAEPSNVSAMAQALQGTLDDVFSQYVGQAQWHEALTDSAQAGFGWKDPRNTFTLPVWQAIFPSARVIHVIRHGVDVAASLARRHSEAMCKSSATDWPSALTVIRESALGVLSSRRGWSIAEAFTMWEQYTEKARLETAALGDRTIEVRFEDVLSSPLAAVERIANFCGVGLESNELAWTGKFSSDRAFAFRGDKTLVEFASSRQAALSHFGYDV